MLLSSDQASLRGSRLLPNASNAVAAVAFIRAVTLDTAQYMTLPPNSATVCLGNTFGTGTLRNGSQVRFRLYGCVTNTGATPQALAPIVRVTQNLPVQTLGFLAQTGNAGTTAWEIDGALTFSLPGAARERLTGGNQYGASKSMAVAGDVLIVGGFLRLMQTTSSFNVGTSQAGGNILTSASGTADSFLVSTNDPNMNAVRPGSVPLSVTVELDSGPNVSIIVQGGWMEALG
jgi:hypothetical protein